MTTSINGTEDYLDTRDISERLEELESDLETFLEEAQMAADSAAEENADEAGAVDYPPTIEESSDFEDYHELCLLREFHEELNGESEYDYGMQLIHEASFEEYLKEFTSEVYPDLEQLPNWLVIDWESTIENLKQDYSYVTIQSETYWFLAQ